MGLFSRIGVGAATVDTILATETVRPGDTVEAYVEVEGGNDEQEVEELELAVETRYRIPSEEGVTYDDEELWEVELDGFTITPSTDRTIEVPPIEIPVSTPATIHQTEVWVGTTLEIDWSADPTDEDELQVDPGPYLDALLTALEDLGLVLEHADNVRSHFGPYEFAQFFEYENHGGSAFRGLDDVEFWVAPARDHLDVQMDVESAGHSLFGSDERRTEFTVTSTDPARVASTVRSVVERNL